MTRRNLLFYSVLAAVWVLVAAWQVEEHVRVRDVAENELRNRAQVIANTLSAIIRGMRFRGGIPKDRIESVLNEMVTNPTNGPIAQTELVAINLLNASNEVVARVGPTIVLQREDLQQQGEHWGQRTVTLVNVVNFDTVILPPLSELTNRVAEAHRDFPHRGPPPDEPPVVEGSNTVSSNSVAAEPPPERDGRPPGDRGFRARRPWWQRGMDDKELQALREQGGLHGLVLTLSTESLQAASAHDLWLRCIIMVLATVSVIGSSLALRNLAKTSDLQLRLVRASELNTHLKEMNLAAAGLAHETRNPLNIIRGRAQMISKLPEAPAEIRERSREIVDEADKVAAQLNEFINYSRPREVRRAVLALGSVINEVVRALSYDLQEKKIQLETRGEVLTIEADEQLLRQALFNLLLNAIQAVDGSGEIEIIAEKQNATEAVLEIRDNGPGVPADRRSEIFKPYFTMQKSGTGLGLAVVQQIVLAHGWEIQCLANEPKGAVFRIAHLKLAGAPARAANPVARPGA
jgi:signal transduction histidine kinase